MSKRNVVSKDCVVKNPDGSESLMEIGQAHHFGGRIVHLASAALGSRGTKFSLDPLIQNHMQYGRRQRESVQAMADFFRENSQSLQAEAMDLAALQLELDFTLERQCDVAKVSINETALMATQRWLIVALPMPLVTNVIQVATVFRDALKDYTPLLETPLPNAGYMFQEMLTDVTTEKTRADVITLLNVLLSESDHVNCHVYSEPDRCLVTAWRGFERSSSESKILQNLPMTASCSEIIDYCQNNAGVIDLTACYWCEKGGMSCSMLLCQQCRAVSYCGRQCQVNDWKGFHKLECKKIKSGDEEMKKELRSTTSRLALLKKPGVQRATFPMQIAPPGDSMWKGDLMILYLVQPEMVEGGARLGKNTKGFPKGFFVKSREAQQYMQATLTM